MYPLSRWVKNSSYMRLTLVEKISWHCSWNKMWEPLERQIRQKNKFADYHRG